MASPRTPYLATYKSTRLTFKRVSNPNNPTQAADSGVFPALGLHNVRLLVDLDTSSYTTPYRSIIHRSEPTCLARDKKVRTTALLICNSQL